MPEVSVAEDDELLIGKNDVRIAGQVCAVGVELQTELAQSSLQFQLVRRVRLPVCFLSSGTVR